MTKAENQAAARVFREDQERKRREADHAGAVKADLAELGKLRRYLILEWKSGSRPQALIDALEAGSCETEARQNV